MVASVEAHRKYVECKPIRGGIRKGVHEGLLGGLGMSRKALGVVVPDSHEGRSHGHSKKLVSEQENKLRA